MGGSTAVLLPVLIKGVISINTKSDIVGTIFIVIMGCLSVFYAYRFVGERAGRLTLASCGIIFYLIFRDYNYKKKKRKEEEEAKSGGKTVYSISKSKNQRVNIGNIAHQSTKDRDLTANQISDAAETAPPETEKVDGSSENK